MKYPTVKEIMNMLEQGGHIAVEFKPVDKRKACVCLGLYNSKRIKPSTVQYLWEHDRIQEYRRIVKKDYTLIVFIHANDQRPPAP